MSLCVAQFETTVIQNISHDQIKCLLLILHFSISPAADTGKSFLFSLTNISSGVGVRMHLCSLCVHTLNLMWGGGNIGLIGWNGWWCNHMQMLSCFRDKMLSFHEMIIHCGSLLKAWWNYKCIIWNILLLKRGLNLFPLLFIYVSLFLSFFLSSRRLHSSVEVSYRQRPRPRPTSLSRGQSAAETDPWRRPRGPGSEKRPPEWWLHQV